MRQPCRRQSLLLPGTCHIELQALGLRLDPQLIALERDPDTHRLRKLLLVVLRHTQPLIDDIDERAGANEIEVLLGCQQRAGLFLRSHACVRSSQQLTALERVEERIANNDLARERHARLVAVLGRVDDRPVNRLRTRPE